MKNLLDQNMWVSVIPIAKGSKKPLVDWKPYQTRQPSPKEISSWKEQWPNCGWAMIVGRISNIIVVDFDCFEDFELAVKKGLPKCPTVRTQRGYHAYFRYQDGIKSLKNISGFKHTELRSDGCCVMQPPSFGPSGFQYRWVDDLSLDEVEPPELPQWLLEGQPSSKEEIKSNPPGWIKNALDDLAEGNRHNTFLKVIGRLHHDGWSPEDILTLLAPHAHRVEFSIDELEEEVEDICKRYPSDYSSPFPPINRGETETEKKPFQIVSLESLLAKKGEDVRWIVNKIFPYESISVIAGPPGYGKSWLTLELALACSLGHRWLGQFETERAKVLYIDEESSEPLLRRRLKKLLKAKDLQGNELDIGFLVSQGLSFSDKTSVDRLRELIEVQKPNLIIVDSLIRVHTAEENSAKEMAAVSKVIKGIVREYKCAFVFCDHQRKPGQFGGGMDLLLRGSTEKLAALDTLLSLRKKEKLLIVEHSKSRFDVETSAFTVSIEDQSPESTIVRYSGDAENQVREDRMKMVTDFLSVSLQGKGWVSRRDLLDRARELAVNEKLLDETLRHLISLKIVEREDRKTDSGRGGKAAFFCWKFNDSVSVSTAENETEMKDVYKEGEENDL